MSGRSKSGQQARVRIKISHPSAIRAQLNIAKRRSVVIHQEGGTLRQARKYQNLAPTSTNDEFPLCQHIDDIVSLPHTSDKNIQVDAQLDRHQDTLKEKEKTKLPPPRPCQDWLPHRQEYVEELLRRDGLGVYAGSLCLHCQSKSGLIRCKDCLGAELGCAECVVEAHKKLPFHRLERWTGRFFEDLALHQIGFKVIIGHEDGLCPSPTTEIRNFTVVDSSGVHAFPLSFCDCFGHPHHRIQLLRAGWLPASIKQPRTAFTFDCLETFQLLNLQGKVSAHDFCKSLDHKSDSTGLKNFPTRYDQFLPASRIWRHMKMVKRAGRGHDPEGIKGTLFGECAVDCPACPYPNINLPADWKTASEDRKWLYKMIRTIDANFKMKQKDKNILNDPPLGDGWAHWVAHEPYKAYIKLYGHQVEPNICDSDLRATDHSNSHGRGVIYNGIGGTLCRHSCVAKNGMGDLAKGERFANMDFITFFSMIGCYLLGFIFSYDIVCQWSRKLKTRIPQLPECMRLSNEQLENSTFVIPKMHIWGHGKSCQTGYSLNFTKWSARTDGEGVERFWAWLNPLSMSTREMGFGSRKDMIDDHARWWNWRKILGFGNSLQSKLESAIEMSSTHRQAFVAHNATFEPETVAKWETLVNEWEKDSRKPNPYEQPEASLNLSEVRLELANEEAADATSGIERGHDTTPSKFLVQGLDLEDQQRILKWKISRPNHTILQAAELQEKRNSLKRRIDSWREVQNIYMPGVHALRLAADREEDESSSTTQPENLKLWLPSEMPAATRTLGCVQDLPDKECRLRLAQADDALHELRRQLRVSATILDFKKNTVGGTSQRNGLRTRTLMMRFHDKTHRCARRYDTAFVALLSLDPNGVWQHRLRRLDHSKDLRLPGRDKEEDADPKKRVSEGRREISWIWLAPRADGVRDAASGDEYSIAMRVEWAKMRARAERWAEEVLLLTEEMRRVIAWFDAKSLWWLNQRSRRLDVSPETAAGLTAYALKQSVMYQDLAKSFGTHWAPLLRQNSIPIEWPLCYTDIPVRRTSSLHP